MTANNRNLYNINDEVSVIFWNKKYQGKIVSLSKINSTWVYGVKITKGKPIKIVVTENEIIKKKT